MIRRSGNFRIAVESLRSSRWRTLLTMLGVIIGVVSVVTTVSLGEGARQGIIEQIEQSGEELITVRPGVQERSRSRPRNLFGTTYSGTLSEGDYRAIESVPGTGKVVPFSFVADAAKRDDKTYKEGIVIGTGEDLPTVLGQKLQYGTFFADDEPQRNAAVIGPRVAEQLFGENVPIGKYLKVRGRQFIVRGIFEEFPTNPLAPNADFNSAIFIQYDVGKELIDSSDIYQILVQPSDTSNRYQLAERIATALRKSHAGQDDFTVLQQEDRLAEVNEILTIMTGFVAGVAAISLIVGGIGILNIMLVSVTERTHEIGIRKAIGATNGQILHQFLTEAIILSGTGGIFGIVLSLVVNYLLRIFTNLTPVLTWPIMVVAFAVSVTVGVIFGITPALTAARKRPIDALRHE